MGTATAKFFRLNGVNLFASGEYRGRRWTPADIDQMAENGPALSGLIVPPAAPGHEDDDGWTEFVPTDEPAAGWVYLPSLRSVPDPDHPGEKILRGDVVNVPAEMAAKIRSGEYRFGSAEIYDDFLDDFGRSRGKVLRKLAYLGAEVPQVKRLGPLPPPVPMAAPIPFSETRRRIRVRRETRGDAVLTFAETDRMDRQQMITAIQAAMPGIAQATLDAMPDDALADLVKNLPAAPAAAPAAPAPAAFADVPRDQMIADLVAQGQDQATLEAMPDDQLAAMYEELVEANPAETMADPSTMTRDELIADLTALGQDPAALAAMTDDDLRAAYAAAAGGTPAPAPAAVPMSERNRRKPATVRQIATAAQSALAGLHRMSERMRRAEKDAEVKPVCDELVRRGFSPAFVNTWVRPALTRLDNEKQAVTFSEGGRKVTGTAFRAKLAEARQLTPEKCFVRFGERLGGAGPGAQTSEAVEVARVRRFAEAHATALKAGGMTGEQYVSKFSEMRRKKPDLTARDYGVPAEFCN